MSWHWKPVCRWWWICGCVNAGNLDFIYSSFPACTITHIRTMWTLAWSVCIHTKCSQLYWFESLHETARQCCSWLALSWRLTVFLQSTDKPKRLMDVFLVARCVFKTRVVFLSGLMDWVAGQLLCGVVYVRVCLREREKGRVTDRSKGVYEQWMY